MNSGYEGKERRVHQCEHEEDITLLKVGVEGVKSDISSIKSDVKEILHLLQGDTDRPGLLTKTELIKHSLNRVWWFISVISAVVIAAFTKHILG